MAFIPVLHPQAAPATSSTSDDPVVPVFDRELWDVSVRELRAYPEEPGACQAQVIPVFDRELWDVSVRELRACPEEPGACQVQVPSPMEKDPNGRSTIVLEPVQFLAPSVFEEGEVKTGLLCQPPNGTPKEPSHSGMGRCRPEVNTLLRGDPSESRLPRYACELAPRGTYTSGKGSSAGGAPAPIIEGPVAKDLALESGALVLSDRGLCCVVESDRMDENARAILHEAMEQQTVGVAKAGIVGSFNARASILAPAKPKHDIHLPKNLMMRFAFIWLLRDKRSRDTDRRLAEHRASMHSESGVRSRPDRPVSQELSKLSASDARGRILPKLTDEAANSLMAGYMDLRNQLPSEILESLVRVSESLAKMELRDPVTSADAAGRGSRRYGGYRHGPDAREVSLRERPPVLLRHSPGELARGSGAGRHARFHDHLFWDGREGGR